MLTKRQSVAVWLHLFSVSFAVRFWYPISRPSNWLQRSYAFKEAITQEDWEPTYQQYHPGVTTMAVGALALHLNERYNDALEPLFEIGAPPFTSGVGSRPGLCSPSGVYAPTN